MGGKKPTIIMTVIIIYIIHFGSIIEQVTEKLKKKK